MSDGTDSFGQTSNNTEVIRRPLSAATVLGSLLPAAAALVPADLASGTTPKGELHLISADISGARVAGLPAQLPVFQVRSSTASDELERTRILSSEVGALVQADDEHFRGLLNSLFTKFGTEAFSQAMAAFAGERYAEKRWLCIEALTDADSSYAIPLLSSYLNSSDAGDRVASASALGSLGDPAAIAALQARLPLETNRVVLSVLASHLENPSKDADASEVSA